ncbi:MAG: hypothetical protein V4675_02395 [Verrucomicrobiota bacterium]
MDFLTSPPHPPIAGNSNIFRRRRPDGIPGWHPSGGSMGFMNFGAEKGAVDVHSAIPWNTFPGKKSLAGGVT